MPVRHFSPKLIEISQCVPIYWLNVCAIYGAKECALLLIDFFRDQIASSLRPTLYYHREYSLKSPAFFDIATLHGPAMLALFDSLIGHVSNELPFPFAYDACEHGRKAVFLRNLSLDQ